MSMSDGYERYALYAIVNSLSSKMLRCVFSPVRHEAGVLNINIYAWPVGLARAAPFGDEGDHLNRPEGQGSLI